MQLEGAAGSLLGPAGPQCRTRTFQVQNPVLSHDVCQKGSERKEPKPGSEVPHGAVNQVLVLAPDPTLVQPAGQNRLWPTCGLEGKRLISEVTSVMTAGLCGSGPQ